MVSLMCAYEIMVLMQPESPKPRIILVIFALRSKLLEMGEGREGDNDKIGRHVELLERKIAKLARREKRAYSNVELGEKILLEKLKMADGGEEGGIR